MKTTPYVGPSTRNQVRIATVGSAGRSSSKTTVTLSPFAFLLCWWLVVLYQTVSAAFVIICGVAHLALSAPAVYQSTWMLAIPQTTLLVAGWGYLFVAALHISALVEIFWHSLVQRRLAFSIAPSQATTHPSFSAIPKAIRQGTARWLGPPRRAWERIFGLSGYLGPQGLYFEFMLRTQQFADIASQTYQAYIISWSLPERAINRLVVGTLVLYCVNAPVIDHLLRRKPALRRLTNLVVELLLDFVSAVLAPLWVLAPSMRDFDYTAGRFPQELTYDDQWVAITTAGGRQVLVNSAIDGVTSLLPHLMSFLAIRTVKDILRSTSTQISDGSMVLLSTIPPLERRRSSQVGVVRRTWRKVLRSRRAAEVMNIVAIAWAIVVVSLHLHAESDAKSPFSSCTLHVLPWMSVRSPCTVAQLNCYRLGTDGQDDTMAVVLSKFDRSSLTKIIFSHCPSLQVPPVVTEFNNLRALELFNSTISKWDHESALTRWAMPRMVQLQLISTNVSGDGMLPVGILHDGLPRDLNLVIYRSNMSELPEDIDKSWGNSVRWIALWIELTNLKALPLTFSALRVTKLSLVGNQLAHLPEDLLITNAKHLSMVRLSDNPLTELPLLAGDLSGLKVFLAEQTLVAAVPDWLSSLSVRVGKKTKTPMSLSLRGSPVCLDSTVSVAVEAVCHDVTARAAQDFRFELIAAQRPM